MSRITDQIDRAGARAETPHQGPALTPRAVAASHEADAERAFRALLDKRDLKREGSPDESEYLVALPESHEADAAEASFAVGRLRGSYRGHPLFVRDDKAGRMLVHALRLLEEDPLADMQEKPRRVMCDAALAHAADAEARGIPLEERLSLDAVDAFLEADPLALCDEGSKSEPPPPPDDVAPVLDALLVLDTEAGATVHAKGGVGLIAMRAGRPALLAAAVGEDVHAVRSLMQIVVAAIDLNRDLAETVRGLARSGPAMALLLDERGAFEAGGPSEEALHVRGYERSPAESSQ